VSPTLSVGRITLNLVEPPELMPFYEGISGALRVTVSQLPWEWWNGHISFPGGLIKTGEFETEGEAALALLTRAKDFHSELAGLLRVLA
jgi:hypothetical protein